MNAVRLLTRVVPILLEDEDGFATRLFWGGEVPALGSGASRSSSGGAGAARGGAAAEALPGAGDVAGDDAADGAGAWEPRGWAHSVEHDPPLGAALIHSVMALLFAPGAAGGGGGARRVCARGAQQRVRGASPPP